MKQVSPSSRPLTAPVNGPLTTEVICSGSLSASMAPGQMRMGVSRPVDTISVSIGRLDPSTNTGASFTGVTSISTVTVSHPPLLSQTITSTASGPL